MGMVYSPDQQDPGITQWYGSAGYQTRGDLIVGFLRVLRDDRTPEGAPSEAVAANNGGSANLGANLLGKKGGSGMGYTVLTWTRDGETWQRDRETDQFFAPDPKSGAWDHAIAWIGSSVGVGDDLFLYYAGYRWGHKYHHSVDRQIGMVRMKRDRFVAREAGKQAGKLATHSIAIDAQELLVNADAKGGEIRVQLTTAEGKPIRGYEFKDCQPITADAITALVQWSRPISELRGKQIRLEFSIREAQLFAFELR